MVMIVENKGKRWIWKRKRRPCLPQCISNDLIGMLENGKRKITNEGSWKTWFCRPRMTSWALLLSCLEPTELWWSARTAKKDCAEFAANSRDAFGSETETLFWFLLGIFSLIREGHLLALQANQSDWLRQHNYLSMWDRDGRRILRQRKSIASYLLFFRWVWYWSWKVSFCASSARTGMKINCASFRSNAGRIQRSRSSWSGARRGLLHNSGCLMTSFGDWGFNRKIHEYSHASQVSVQEKKGRSSLPNQRCTIWNDPHQLEGQSAFSCWTKACYDEIWELRWCGQGVNRRWNGGNQSSPVEWTINAISVGGTVHVW